MIKIESVVKNDDYYQIVLTEGRKLVGVILGVLEDKIDVEFLVPDPVNQENFMIINEEENSELLEEYNANYLNPVLEYVNKMNNN
jgi:hypothetical protein